MKPLVSIITPIYNGEKTIGKTIQSVINQTYNKFEMIIVDDLSNDKTVDIVKKYQKKDDRIKLFILDKKSGASGARNFAIKKATGKYVAFLDGDDLWKKDKLEKQVKFMEDNKIYFSYTDYCYIDSEGNDLKRRIDIGDGDDELHHLAVLRHLLELLGVAEHGQVLGEVALLEHVQPGLVQAVGEVDQGGVAVQLR